MSSKLLDQNDGLTSSSSSTSGSGCSTVPDALSTPPFSYPRIRTAHPLQPRPSRITRLRHYDNPSKPVSERQREAVWAAIYDQNVSCQLNCPQRSSCSLDASVNSFDTTPSYRTFDSSAISPAHGSTPSVLSPQALTSESGSAHYSVQRQDIPRDLPPPVSQTIENQIGGYVLPDTYGSIDNYNNGYQAHAHKQTSLPEPYHASPAPSSSEPSQPLSASSRNSNSYAAPYVASPPLGETTQTLPHLPGSSVSGPQAQSFHNTAKGPYETPLASPTGAGYSNLGYSQGLAPLNRCPASNASSYSPMLTPAVESSGYGSGIQGIRSSRGYLHNGGFEIPYIAPANSFYQALPPPPPSAYGPNPYLSNNGINGSSSGGINRAGYCNNGINDESMRVHHSRPKPQCWDHGCNGREFSTFSNLLRHQREKSGTASKSNCPRCGAEFTRTTARNGHLAHDKCKRRQNRKTINKNGANNSSAASVTSTSAMSGMSGGSSMHNSSARSSASGSANGSASSIGFREKS